MRALLILCLAMPAFAQVDDGRTGGERITDALGIAGLTLVTTVAGAGVAGGVSEVTSRDCFSDDCFEGDFLFGVIVGGSIGLLMGPLLFDDWSDGDGSLAGAYGGLFLGALTAPATGPFGPLLGLGLGYAIGDSSEDVKPTVNVRRAPEGEQHWVFGLSGQF